MMEENNRLSTDGKNEQMLNSVIFMKRASIICCILQSISLCIFVVAYNPTIIYYLPIFWSVSCSIFALNFIRNRMFVKAKLFQFAQIIKYKYGCNIFSSKQIIKSPNLKPHFSDNKSKSNSNRNALCEIILTDEKNDTHKFPERNISTPIQSQSDRNVFAKILMNSKPQTLQLSRSNPIPNTKNNSDTSVVAELEQKQHSPTFKKTNKALELLGIQPSNSRNSPMANISGLQTQHSLSRLSLKNVISNSMSKGDYVDVGVVESAAIDRNIKVDDKDVNKLNEENEDVKQIEIDLKVDGGMEMNLHKIEASEMDIDEALESFKLFAKYGFLSNKNINSAAQVRNYNVSVQQRKSAAFNTLAVPREKNELNDQSRNKPADIKWSTRSNSLQNSKSKSNNKNVQFVMQ